MGNWPLHKDYAQAMQNPKSAFPVCDVKKGTKGLPKELGDWLQACKIKADKNNQPVGMSGAFAVVYKATLTDQRNMALRVFTSYREEVNRRYNLISQHLEKHANLNPLVHFKFHEHGIKVPDKQGQMNKYPLVTMDWVPGDTLYDWVDKRCKARDQKSLGELTAKWQAMVNDLAAAKIAHGDLQHANVIVNQNGQVDLKLVDYDCMCVPALVRQPNLEIGVEPYQPKKRDQSTLLSLQLDHFSSIFIFVALRALTESPKLWDDFVVNVNYDKLLFKREDFENPKTSSLCQSLIRLRDADIGRMTKDLCELFDEEIDKIPSLEDFLFSFDKVESLLNAGDFDKAVDLLDRSGQAGKMPAKIKGEIQHARRIIQAREGLEKAEQAGDEAAMQRLYDPGLLKYPRARRVAEIAKDAHRVVPIIGRLEAARRGKKWRDFVQIWDAERKLLDGRASCRRFKTDVDTWRDRNRACDAFLREARNSNPNVTAMDAAWSALQRLGGHPEADPFRAKVGQLVARHKAWTAFAAVLQRAKAGNSQQVDQQLVEAWNETAFAGWDQAERVRSDVEQARGRLRLVDIVGQLVRRAAQSTTQAGEKAIVAQAENLRGYDYESSARVAQARQRLAACESVRQSIAKAQSESRIAETFRELDKLGGKTMVDAGVAARVQLAEERLPLLDKLKQIPGGLPLDQFDRRILSTWKDDVLRQCREAQPWLAKYDAAVRRADVLKRLQQAISRRDENLIVDLSSDPCLDRFPLRRDWTHEIETARKLVVGARELLKAVENNDQPAFRQRFDARLIRHNRSMFSQYQERVVRMVRESMLSTQAIGLQPAIVGKNLLKMTGGSSAYRVKWTFPQPKFTEDCILGITPRKPTDDFDPRSGKVSFRLPIDRKRFQDGGGALIHPPKSCRGGYVSVWAVIDIGLDTFISKPLVLGRLG